MNIGDIRTELARDLRENLEGIINTFAKKEQYYILVYADWDTEQVLRTRYVIMDKKPILMLGTIAFRVDNRKGQLWRLWVLPKDVPRNDMVIDEQLLPFGHPELEKGDRGILEWVDKVPLIH